MPLQDQIYIVAGTLGGVILLLILLILALCMSIVRSGRVSSDADYLSKA